MKSKDVFRSLSLTVAVSAVVACGGGSGGETVIPEPTTVSYTGKVIDGYVSGATVFLDMNWNGQLDKDEPSVLSSESGNYTLELNEEHHECVPYVPLVVDVPVGAMDEDLGEVTEAYQMVFPPMFEPLEDRVANITPITSIIWEGMAQQLQARGKLNSNSCSVIRDDYEKRQELLDLVEQAVADAVTHYNISASQILDDYIASGNEEIYQIAQDIVRGLKASLKDTLKLRKDYPDALYAKVRYHKFSYIDNGDAYPNAWYRHTEVLNTDGSMTELVKMSDNLQSEVRTILYSESLSGSVGDVGYITESVHESRQGDDSPYNCENSERIFFSRDSVQFELTNFANTSNIEAFNDCDGDFAKSTGRYLFANYEQDGVEFGAQFSYSSEGNGFGFLDEFFNLADNAATLDVSVLGDYVGALSYQYGSEGDPNADWWVKTRTFTEGDDTIGETLNSDGSLKRRTTHADGTWDESCSYDDGLTFGTCSE